MRRSAPQEFLLIRGRKPCGKPRCPPSSRFLPHPVAQPEDTSVASGTSSVCLSPWPSQPQLADPTRRAILDMLAKGPRTTGEACAHFARPKHRGIGRTGVMKHLDVLQAANLVIVRREGRHRWNHLNPVPIQRVCDRWVSRHVRDISRSALRLKELVEGKP